MYRTLVTRHRRDQSCLAICTSVVYVHLWCPYLPGSPGILFDEPCCGTCYTVYCACTPTYTCTISYIYPPIYVKSYHAHAHAICADLAGHETGDPSVEAEIGKRGGVHGSAAEITQYAAMSTSHCRNRRLLVLVRRVGGNTTTRVYIRTPSTLNSHSLARPAAHSTAFIILPCRQNCLEM